MPSAPASFPPRALSEEDGLLEFLKSFAHREEGALSSGARSQWAASDSNVPVLTNEYWTSRQRQASSIHEISYRACFKPQLPRFFVELLTRKGDVVYDPFLGRGTTAIETALLGRLPIGNDINPLSQILTIPRLWIPSLDEVSRRLAEISLSKKSRAEIDLSMFYHPETEAEIVSLKNYLARRLAEGEEDDADRWIRMVATNRLTGHSRGFFSVYTLPPNQAASQKDQRRINEKRGQEPEYRDVKAIILKKTKSLLRDLTPDQISMLDVASRSALFLSNDAAKVPEIKSESVRLTVTSPPFLDIVEYSKDNWLRSWFNGVDAALVALKITMSRTVEAWTREMRKVFHELYRITAVGGHVAFEVGEVRKGKIKLEDSVVSAGFDCVAIMVNEQRFTKTSNIWGIGNNAAGTNTNRIVIFRKMA